MLAILKIQSCLSFPTTKEAVKHHHHILYFKILVAITTNLSEGSQFVYIINALL